MITTYPAAAAGAGGTQYDEDTAHVSGDKVTLAGVVQQNADAALSTDGDRSLLQVDATGFLKASIKGAALTSLQLLDDTVFAEDVAATAADKGVAILAVRRDADTTLVDTTNDYANLQVNDTGRLKVVLPVGGVGLTDTELRATPVPVSGTVSVTEPVSVDDNGGALTVDAVDLDIRNLTFAADKVDASGSTGVGVTGPLTDAQLRATAVPVSGTVTANPALGFGKTLQFAAIAQGAAGTTELVAAVGGQKIKLVSYAIVLSLTGTARFRSGAATNMTGDMDFAANGGAAMAGDVSNPLMQTVSGEALNIVTTVGAARGHLSYFTEA